MLVHLEVPVAELVLMVRISERVFKSVWIILEGNRVDVWGFWIVVGIAGFS